MLPPASVAAGRFVVLLYVLHHSAYTDRALSCECSDSVDQFCLFSVSPQKREAEWGDEERGRSSSAHTAERSGHGERLQLQQPLIYVVELVLLVLFQSPLVLSSREMEYFYLCITYQQTHIKMLGHHSFR